MKLPRGVSISEKGGFVRVFRQRQEEIDQWYFTFVEHGSKGEALKEALLFNNRLEGTRRTPALRPTNKVSRRSSTGVVGVGTERDKRTGQITGYRAYWSEMINGEIVQSYTRFKLKDYGKELAFELAVQTRIAMVDEHMQTSNT